MTTAAPAAALQRRPSDRPESPFAAYAAYSFEEDTPPMRPPCRADRAPAYAALVLMALLIAPAALAEPLVLHSGGGLGGGGGLAALPGLLLPCRGGGGVGAGGLGGLGGSGADACVARRAAARRRALAYVLGEPAAASVLGFAARHSPFVAAAAGKGSGSGYPPLQQQQPYARAAQAVATLASSLARPFAAAAA